MIVHQGRHGDHHQNLPEIGPQARVRPQAERREGAGGSVLSMVASGAIDVEVSGIVVEL
jgi:hypothetical protein